jgi:DNA-binding response OmpR family regulator
MLKRYLQNVILVLLTPVAVLGQYNFEVTLRSIGHSLLLQNGDSISRVLPVQERNGIYTLSFDKELGIHPKELTELINAKLQASKNTQNYLVKVKECSSLQVVYSYEVSDKMGLDSIPCQSRPLPSECYKIELSFFGKQIPLNQTELEQALSDPKDNSNYKLYFVLVFLLGASPLLVFYYKRQSKTKSKSLLVIGKYQFDPLNLVLIYEKHSIALTTKEADLLQLLLSHTNETIEKETLLTQVWGNTDGYLGRTLDVFISKLRKKLNLDQNIKILNVRGVGYKLILNKESV